MNEAVLVPETRVTDAGRHHMFPIPVIAGITPLLVKMLKVAENLVLILPL